ncbi:MAG: hypothetical protein M3430_20680 [Acidobacteriota bacterium]|nr:hypothetical protein [Acidobacteriota bacterium]
MFRNYPIILLVALINLCAATESAVARTQTPQPDSAQTSPRRVARPKLRAHDRRTGRPAPAAPVTLFNSPVPDYLSGEARVSVRGNQNAVIKLGIAKDGVTIIEFPAADRFFAIHPGNSDLVTVDDSPTKATDRFMVLRAGSGFVAPSASKAKSGAGPSTSIIVQMQSGMVITLMLYPVPRVAQGAHRCVINYDRAEVIAARRGAGLTVNLDGADPGALLSASAIDANSPRPLPKLASTP